MANVISDETMEYVGILAKLELSDAEKEAAKKDMESIRHKTFCMDKTWRICVYFHSVFDQIREHVDTVSNQVERVSDAVDVVAGDSENIEQKITAIDGHSHKVLDDMQSASAATEEQTASAEEIASASDALAKLTQNMNHSLKQFKY